MPGPRRGGGAGAGGGGGGGGAGGSGGGGGGQRWGWHAQRCGRWRQYARGKHAGAIPAREQAIKATYRVEFRAVGLIEQDGVPQVTEAPCSGRPRLRQEESLVGS
jgi:hypothetical protein